MLSAVFFMIESKKKHQQSIYMCFYAVMYVKSRLAQLDETAFLSYRQMS